MTWETIQPRRGQRVNSARGATISWRTNNSSAGLMCVTISRLLAEDLGWQRRQRIQVQRDMASRKLRITLGQGADTFSLSGTKTGNVLAAAFGFPGLVLDQPQKAQPTPHQVEGGALILDLPDWALGKSYIEKKESALALLRTRVDIAQVVRETGLSPREVVRMAEQVRGEREGRAA